MEQRFLEKITNPAVRKELAILFNNGFSLKEEHLQEFISKDLKSNLLQVFPTVQEEKILRNINLNLSKAANILLIVRANQGLYWKATELAEFISENTEAEIMWNFQPSQQIGNVIKIITISY